MSITLFWSLTRNQMVAKGDRNRQVLPFSETRDALREDPAGLVLRIDDCHDIELGQQSSKVIAEMLRKMLKRVICALWSVSSHVRPVSNVRWETSLTLNP